MPSWQGSQLSPLYMRAGAWCFRPPFSKLEWPLYKEKNMSNSSANNLRDFKQRSSRSKRRRPQAARLRASRSEFDHALEPRSYESENYLRTLRRNQTDAYEISDTSRQSRAPCNLNFSSCPTPGTFLFAGGISMYPCLAALCPTPFCMPTQQLDATTQGRP